MPRRMNNRRNVKRRRPYRKRRATTKRATTRRVYNKNYKRQTVKILQPIAESRKLSFVNTSTPRALGETVGTENWFCIVPETWDHMYRENFLDTLPDQPASKGFTGKTLFSRYLNQQIKIRFDTIEHYAQPVDIQVIYGWSKIPYITPLQSTGSDSARNEYGVLIAHDREQLITRSLSKMYNVMFPVTDPKAFKLMYNKRFQVRGETVEGLEFVNPGPGVDIKKTIRKDLDYKISWRPNTKYHMTAATKGDGSNGAEPPGNSLSPDSGFINFETTQTPNTTAFWTPSDKKNGDVWTPFFAVRVINAGTYGKDPEGNNSVLAYPLVYQQNSHYFYDL